MAPQEKFNSPKKKDTYRIRNWKKYNKRWWIREASLFGSVRMPLQNGTLLNEWENQDNPILISIALFDADSIKRRLGSVSKA